MAITGIIATLVGSLWSARIAADAALSGVRTQIASETAKESREKVARVYSDFLSAADAYAQASVEMSVAVGVYDMDRLSPTSQEIFKEAYKQFQTARSAMQSRTNDLYAFASREAWDASITLKNSLPEAFTPYEDDGGALKYDRGKYEQAYRTFQRQYCLEVAPEERTQCTGG
ncbi:hypothetical protein ACIQHF_01340 [Pseudarthrobacter oxydans]|uniref:hypothetical protein n=1 Tax=Pseudarthrobacter oxydans TaxID=1671 RepID=UPI00380CE779